MPGDRYFILDPFFWAEKILKLFIEKGALIMLYFAQAFGNNKDQFLTHRTENQISLYLVRKKKTSHF